MAKKKYPKRVEFCIRGSPEMMDDLKKVASLIGTARDGFCSVNEVCVIAITTFVTAYLLRHEIMEEK